MLAKTSLSGSREQSEAELTVESAGGAQHRPRVYSGGVRQIRKQRQHSRVPSIVATVLSALTVWYLFDAWKRLRRVLLSIPIVHSRNGTDCQGSPSLTASHSCAPTYSHNTQPLGTQPLNVIRRALPLRLVLVDRRWQQSSVASHTDAR